MMMENKKIISIELKMNNTLFYCKLEEKYYNIQKKKCYAVKVMVGVAPDITKPGMFQPTFESMTICEECWNENKKDDKLAFEEPTKIVLAPGKLPEMKN